ncbi:MAG: NADH-quinone oxidoreductase subunit NuoK [Deltaproteobacteria bacterium]|nr:NADH-quinone oxidoreductase subunit NuoK [Deltaproteobacteria bacterium]
MGPVTLQHYLVLSMVLFGIGLAGIATRRNALIMMMCVELMLNASNLALVAYSRHLGVETGQVMAFFVMALAAAEAAVGLALLLAVFRHLRTVNVDEMRQLRG